MIKKQIKVLPTLLKRDIFTPPDEDRTIRRIAQNNINYSIPMVQDEQGITERDIKVVLQRSIHVQPDEEYIRKIIPLTGKWLPSYEGADLGWNFKTLKNMRYTDTHPKMIGGHSILNATPLATYLKVRSAIHFRKQQPAESHVMVQAFNAGFTDYRIMQNITAVPGTGNFESTVLFTPSAGLTDRGYFSKAPDESVAFCNGTDSLIWPGNEGRCGGFYVYSPSDDSNVWDYTDQINNSRTDSYATMHTIDTVTSLWHFDNSPNDAIGSHNFTLGGGTGYTAVAGEYKFGTHALSFNSSSASVDITSQEDFQVANRSWTSGGWVRQTDMTVNRGIFELLKDGNNYCTVYVTTAGAVTMILREGGVDVMTLSSSNGEIVSDTYYNIEIVHEYNTGNNGWYIFKDGNVIASTTNIYTTRSDYVTLYLGYSTAASNGWTGQIDEWRWMKGVAAHTSAFSAPTDVYAQITQSNLRIISTLPLKGVKFYIGTANTSPATVTGKYWTGAMTALASLSDGTSVTGKALAQTGSITFDTTTADAKVRISGGMAGFYYDFVFIGIDATTTVYRCTLISDMQTIKDIWDGADRNVIAFYQYRGSPATYLDYTLNVLENSYDANDAATYVELDSLTASTNFLVAGLSEQVMGLNIGLIGGHVNTTLGTVCTVYFSSDGSTWTTVGTISDGTSSSGISFSRSGAITWDPPDILSEVRSKVSREAPAYHIKLEFSQNLSADVQMFHISGIPAPRTLSRYKFPLMAQNRLFLCADMYGKKNSILFSASETNCVFNGDDSGELEFERAGELNCGCELYSQFGSSLYNLILFFTDNEMLKLSGSGPDWTKHVVEDTIGCPAADTLKTVSLPPEVAPGMNRNVAMWQGNSGIYISDGRSPIPVHGDIENYFDKRKPECIKASEIGNSTAIMDYDKLEYHWQFKSGAAGTDKELVFDLKRWKWFEIDRDTGAYLQCGVETKDTYGNTYAYGFIDTGHMLRLEDGNYFEKSGGHNDIAGIIELGDNSLLDGEILVETRVHKLNVLAVQSADNTLAYTHCVDTETSGTTFSAISLANAAGRTANIIKTIDSKVGILHSGKLAVTNGHHDTVGFEPLALAYIFQVEREHLT